MASTRIVHTKEVQDDGSIIEIVVWLLDSPVLECEHLYKYRLFYRSPTNYIIRYDNERGKGDHRHLGDIENPYHFVSIPQLIAHFQQDIESRE